VSALEGKSKMCLNQIISNLRRGCVKRPEPPAISPPVLPVTIGTYTDVRSLRQAVYDTGFKFDVYSRTIFEKLIQLVPETTIKTKIVSLAQLGLPGNNHRNEIFDAMLSHGIRLGPPEVLLYFILQYPDQLPRDRELYVAMEPVVDSPDTYGRIVAAVHGDSDYWEGWWIITDQGIPTERWYTVDLFLVCVDEDKHG